MTKKLVKIVGAGPGDAELITLKGIKALQEADAVLYDSLSNKELLKYTPKTCKNIYVGKRYSCKSASQEVINQLLVHCTFKYGKVVRLKGGDPSVFGRVWEEIDYCSKHGIDTEIIPGISSSIAGPALVGIPLTNRGHNESFWITTATLKTGELSSDIALALQSTATVVILMGLYKLEEIAALYMTYEKGEMPCAVIQNASLPNQKMVVGTIKEIHALAKQASITSPAIIVAGKNVGRILYNQYALKEIAAQPVLIHS